MRANDHDGGDRLIRRRQVLFKTSVLLERQPLQVSPMSAMATRLFRQLGAISSGVERNGLTRGGTIHATRVHRHRIGHFMRRKRDRIVLNAAIITNYHLSIVRGPATIAGGWSCGDLGPEDKLRVLAGLESQIFSTYEVAIDHGSPIGQDASALRQVGQVRAVDRHPVPDAGLGDIQYRLGRQGVGLGSGSAIDPGLRARGRPVDMVAGGLAGHLGEDPELDHSILGRVRIDLVVREPLAARALHLHIGCRQRMPVAERSLVGDPSWAIRPSTTTEITSMSR